MNIRQRHEVEVDEINYRCIRLAWEALKLPGNHRQFRIELKREKRLSRYGHDWVLGKAW